MTLEEIEAKADGRMKRKILALRKLFDKGSCKSDYRRRKDRMSSL
jgi:hypothetical protein